MSNAPRRRAFGMAVLVMALIASLAAAAVMVNAQRVVANPARAVTADPTTGLVDGQVVSVGWQGFTPDEGVVLRQCGTPVTSAKQCSTLLQNEPSDGLGAGSTTFPVLATDGDRTLRGAKDVKCTIGKPCSIGVFPDAAPNDLTQAAFVTLQFAAPATGCPTPGPRSITAEGSDAASRAIAAWQSVLCEAPDRTALDFVSKNDPSGRQDFLCGLRDIAITQRGPKPGEVCNSTGKGRAAVKIAPLSVSALTFAFNVRDQRTGKRILDLQLTPNLLAMIFTGQVLRWNDPRIAALNPNYSLPTKMRVVGRADSSDLNLQLTEFFWTTARDAYLAGGPAFADGITETYPSISGIDLRTGGDSVGQSLAFPSENDPRDDPSFGYIGVLDSSAAALRGLPAVAIESPDKSRFVAPTADAISRGLAAMTADSRSVLLANPEPADQAAYRMPVVSYANLPTDRITADQLDAIRRFVGYANGKGQAIDVLPRGYVMLPADLRDQAVKAAAGLTAVAAAPKPSSSASPTPTPAANPDSGSGDAGLGSLAGGSTGDLGAALSDDSAPGAAVAADAAPGTAAVAAGNPTTVTSVFARTGSESPGLTPFLLPALMILAAAGFVVGPAMMRSSR